MNILKALLFVVVTSVIFASASLANAHGLGTSKNQVVGNYFIVFEYDALGNVAADTFTSYDMDFQDANTKEFLDYSRLFLRITQKGHNTPFFTGNVAPVDIFGKKAARINMTIPDAGDYTAKLDFYDVKNQKLTEASFDFAVDPPTQYGNANTTDKAGAFDPKKYLWIAALVGGIIIGMVIAKLIKRQPASEHKD